jgi:uncharacterized protein (DUF2267 family)
MAIERPVTIVLAGGPMSGTSSDESAGGWPAPRVGIATEIFQELRAGGSLPVGVGPDEATAAVLCTLLGRLELEPAQLLLDALGTEAVQAIGSCPVHGGQSAETFGGREMLTRVASHFELSPEAVQPMTAAVLSAVRRRIPFEVARLVVRALPAPIAEMWRGAGAGAGAG